MIVVPEGLDDPRLAVYRDLKDRDAARLEGAFVAEGLEVVSRLVYAPWRVRSLLVAKSKLDRLRVSIPSLPPEVPVFALPMDELREVVGFDLHRGVLAAGERGSGPDVEPTLAREGPLALLALVGLSNTDNVGACFRHAAAFGVHAVLLDRTSADPLYRRSLRVSMGHALRVPFCRIGEAADLMGRLREAGVASVALSPGDEGLDAGELFSGRAALPARFALLVGAEGEGLSADVLEAADVRVRIPMAGGTDSLNAATAAAVALFAARQASPSSFVG